MRVSAPCSGLRAVSWASQTNRATRPRLLWPKPVAHKAGVDGIGRDACASEASCQFVGEEDSRALIDSRRANRDGAPPAESVKSNCVLRCASRRRSQYAPRGYFEGVKEQMGEEKIRQVIQCQGHLNAINTHMTLRKKHRRCSAGHPNGQSAAETPLPVGAPGPALTDRP